MKSPRDVIERWSARILADPNRFRQLQGSFKLILNQPGEDHWVFFCKEPVSVFSGKQAEQSEADCTVEMTKQDFLLMACGELNPQVAFLNGQIRLSGDFEQALKFILLFGPVEDGIPSIH